MVARATRSRTLSGRLADRKSEAAAFKRPVFIGCGRAPRSARRVAGRYRPVAYASRCWRVAENLLLGSTGHRLGGPVELSLQDSSGRFGWLRLVPPHPYPLPQGEGTPYPALQRLEALLIGESASSDSPSPRGRVSLSPHRLIQVQWTSGLCHPRTNFRTRSKLPEALRRWQAGQFGEGRGKRVV
jgi:hypothetical protein